MVVVGRWGVALGAREGLGLPGLYDVVGERLCMGNGDDGAA